VNDCNDSGVVDIALCLKGIQLGDEAAARVLVRAMTPFVMKIIRAHLPPLESEQDLAQKVFIRMFQKITQYSGVVPFQHWLSRIAVNTCLNQIAVEKRHAELRWSDLSEEQVQVIDTLSTDQTEPDVAASIASRDLVEKLLTSLKPKERLVINLLYLEGRTIAEIHELTGWSRPLIKIRAYRARLRLRSQLARLKESKL
jgi:RNA polymerase sigma factor (sigma-70 family)